MDDYTQFFKDDPKRKYRIRFDGPPGPEAGRFVEVENENGESINVGEWKEQNDGTWILEIPDERERIEEIKSILSDMDADGELSSFYKIRAQKLGIYP